MYEYLSIMLELRGWFLHAVPQADVLHLFTHSHHYQGHYIAHHIPSFQRIVTGGQLRVDCQ